MPSQISMLVNILQAWKYNAREAWVRIRCSLPKAHVYLQRPANSGEAITGLTDETVGPAGDILPRVTQVCGSRTSELLHLQWGGASAPLSYSLGSFINSLSRLNVFICFGTSLVCSRFAVHRDNHFTNIQLQTKRFLSLGFGTQCQDAAWFPYVLHGHKLIKGKGCSVQFLTVFCVGSSLRPHPCLDLTECCFLQGWALRCPTISGVTSLPRQLWGTSELDKNELPFMFSTGCTHCSGYSIVCCYMDLSLFMLISQAGSISTCQPFQMHLQPQNCSQCLAPTLSSWGLGQVTLPLHASHSVFVFYHMVWFLIAIRQIIRCINWV